MAVLRIRHTVPDYDAWRARFDADPMDRRGSGVLRYSVARSVELPNDVVIDLEFANVAQARAMLRRLQTFWTGADAPTVAGIDTVLLDPIDTVELTT